jgi:hypothetical protein
MRLLACSLCFSLILASSFAGQNVQAADPVILSPRPGDVLHGVMIIVGNTSVDGFDTAEISFTYTNDPTGTWFLIASNSLPVENDRLAAWDTTVITDGDYILRLEVLLKDGSSRKTEVQDLHIRNYTSLDYPTAISTNSQAGSMSNLMKATPYPTPTSLPRNPAALSQGDIFSSIFYGILAAILAFIMFSIYLWLRRRTS